MKFSILIILLLQLILISARKLFIKQTIQEKYIKLNIKTL